MLRAQTLPSKNIHSQTHVTHLRKSFRNHLLQNSNALFTSTNSVSSLPACLPPTPSSSTPTSNKFSVMAALNLLGNNYSSTDDDSTDHNQDDFLGLTSNPSPLQDLSPLNQNPLSPFSSSSSDDDDQKPASSSTPTPQLTFHFNQNPLSPFSSSSSDDEQTPATSSHTPTPQLTFDFNHGQQSTSTQPQSTQLLTTHQQHNQNASPLSRSSDHDELTASSSTSNSRRGKYALSFSMLPTIMKMFLKELKSHYTKPVNLVRQKPPVLPTTYAKAQERLLCFLGFASNHLGLQLTPDLFLRLTVIEQYLTYLKVVRQLSSSTMANHTAALLYPAKFMHLEQAPDFLGVPVIKQLRAQVASLQRIGQKESPSSKEDLESLNKWLDWNEIVATVALQKERVDMARTADTRARESADLLLLSLYVLIPPSRGLEIRTLELLPQAMTMASPELSNKNLIELHEDGSVTLKFQKYKTKKTYGVDTTLLKNDHELSHILRDYLNKHRPKLVNDKSHNFLLLNKNGAPFSGPAFSGHLKFLFLRLTGVNVSVNVLRSSFLTHAYGMSDCTDALKDSLAAALRHSRKQAQVTYDRRNSNERKQLAVSLASDIAQSNNAGVSEDSSREEHGSLKVGDYVALVEEASTLDQPKILLGRIQSFQPGRQAALLWYQHNSGAEYAFEFDDQPWVESVDALHLVKTKYVNKKPGFVKLCTSLKTIHKAAQ